jgi:hypothetical protein
VGYLLQYTEEKLGKAEQTPLDAHFENLLARADKTEEHTRRLLACMEGYLQPNPSRLIGAQLVHTLHHVQHCAWKSFSMTNSNSTNSRA